MPISMIGVNAIDMLMQICVVKPFINCKLEADLLVALQPVPKCLSNFKHELQISILKLFASKTPAAQISFTAAL